MNPTPLTMLCLIDASRGCDGAVGAALADWTLMTNEAMQRQFGHDDFDDSVENLTTSLGQQEQTEKWLVLLVAGLKPDTLAEHPSGLALLVPDATWGQARVVAGTNGARSRSENTTTLGELEVIVNDDHRRQGLGSRVMQGVHQLADWAGCRTLTGWATHPMSRAQSEANDLVRPKEGPFGVSRDDPLTRFAQGHGFGLAQTERHSMQRLDDPRALAEPRLAEGYRLHHWAQFTPEVWLDDVAGLQQAMSEDAPKGELDKETEFWDAERLRTAERNLDQRRRRVVTAAEHIASGRLAGYTVTTRYPHATGALFQGNTVVLSAHRGHGLGRTLKLANLVQAREAWPMARRVHTWNAGENDHIWAINESIGYQSTNIVGAWTKKLA